MANINTTIEQKDGAVVIKVASLGTSVFTITPDGYGLIVSVEYVNSDGIASVTTQLGMACINKVSAHLDVL